MSIQVKHYQWTWFDLPLGRSMERIPAWDAIEGSIGLVAKALGRDPDKDTATVYDYLTKEQVNLLNHWFSSNHYPLRLTIYWERLK